MLHCCLCQEHILPCLVRRLHEPGEDTCRDDGYLYSSHLRCTGLEVQSCRVHQHHPHPRGRNSATARRGRRSQPAPLATGGCQTTQTLPRKGQILPPCHCSKYCADSPTELMVFTSPSPTGPTSTDHTTEEYEYEEVKVEDTQGWPLCLKRRMSGCRARPLWPRRRNTSLAS